MTQMWQYMYAGLALSSRRTYSVGEWHFIHFCCMWDIRENDGSLLPTSKMTLMLFVSYLVDFRSHASIKVYLYGVRSMHIEAGFRNPLRDKLCLHRVLHGVKRCKGGPRPKCLPIT